MGTRYSLLRPASVFGIVIGAFLISLLGGDRNATGILWRLAAIGLVLGGICCYLAHLKNVIIEGIRQAAEKQDQRLAVIERRLAAPGASETKPRQEGG